MKKQNCVRILGALVAFVFTLVSLETKVGACTAFNYTSEGVTLVGNNEDWNMGNPTIKVYPGQNGEYGRIYITYWFLVFWMPFAGVNEHGLMFDIFLTPISDSKNCDWGKTLRIGFELSTKAMKTCTTVDEVVALFSKHNLFMPGFQLFFTDRQGDSVVIGGSEYIHKQGNYQVVTNHFLFDPESGSDDSRERYANVSEKLSDLEAFSIREFASICEGESKPFFNQQGDKEAHPTQYSYVLDLENLLMYLFRAVDNQRVDYHNAAVLDIVHETSKPRHSIKFNDLEFSTLLHQ